MNKNNGWKVGLIVAGIIIAIVLCGVVWVQSAQNRAIGLEESVYTAESDIKVQEKARVDKVYNLADCVKQYDKHESNTLSQLAESMSKGNQIEDVNTALAAVTYAYPELKSNENYKQLMQELTVIENQLSQYRENYNNGIKKYNSYVKRFPTRIFLSWTGYEVHNFERLDYQAPVSAPTKLFED
ncbi:LemA family protein [Clostridium sp. AM43-3BH]|jgi:LemA protein|uniref:LemA family protein n=1 Tax=unclassified Clostridium TaxID=2614128 RepID=UPI000E53A2BC|nr:LemA family protein [Clostridium sp. AM43-3BH]RHO87481.1 LemA family protein [Clostridium sp. AF37-7]RHQ84135.1 LemA family protein [Clostridium sp. AF22-10]RHS74058.1 LemA family protein [Clostridium sp. AM43-3BH]